MNKKEQLKRLICALYRQDEPEDYTDECMEDMLDNTELAGQLVAVREELKPMKDIRYWVGKVLAPEQAVEKKPEPKHSVTERLKHDSGQEKRQPERKPTQHKKQDMEL